jgi:hypothetical protein
MKDQQNVVGSSPPDVRPCGRGDNVIDKWLMILVRRNTRSTLVGDRRVLCPHLVSGDRECLWRTGRM